MLALSPAAIRQSIGMPSSTYRDQFVKLIDKGYLVQRGESNTFDFYETPQRVTQTKKDNTIDGYDFAADDVITPQTAQTDTAENIEINNRDIEKNTSINNETLYPERVVYITSPIAEGKKRPPEQQSVPKGEFVF